MQNSVSKGYEYAKEQFGVYGVDIDAAIQRADSIPVSMHCWQGDDVIGFDGVGELTGGITTTGNYPGRASDPQELRGDIDKALSLIPGTSKLNLHACYAEKHGKKIDRDEYTIDEFREWLDWAKQKPIGLDFNPTYFSHPKMDGDFSLASGKPEIRRFWIEHGKRCREIALAFATELKKPCVVDYWMPDGYKDSCVDTRRLRDVMIKSLDEIFAEDIDKELVPCCVESKLFGMGIESYTVASHEFSLLYAQTRGLLYCLDAGHFHPTEVISAKISAVLSFMDKAMLHVSRGVRWDSDHVIALDDELKHIMEEILWNDYDKRVCIGLDYFDASINRIACWVIGMRNARKALLAAALAPVEKMREAEVSGDLTSRFALYEARKSLPYGAVWDYYCESKGIPSDLGCLSEVKKYEKDVLSKR